MKKHFEALKHFNKDTQHFYLSLTSFILALCMWIQMITVDEYNRLPDMFTIFGIFIAIVIALMSGATYLQKQKGVPEP
jgi:hypothetical protein